MGKSVIIIGGGLAGLATAVFLCDKGYDISIYESTPKWGGRTYSFYDKEKTIYLDNGQHILAGWYENSFEYLKKIGTFNRLKIKNHLNLHFCTNEKKLYEFRCRSLPGLYSLLWGVFTFKGFNLNDKLKFLKVRGIVNNKFSDDYLKKINADKLLNEIEQTENLRKYFWNPLIIASFNTLPEYVNAELLVKLIKKGTEKKKNMSIILSDAYLNDLFIDNTIRILKEKEVKMHLSLGVKSIEIVGDKVSNIILSNGDSVKGDYYIATVPNYSFEKLFEKENYSRYFCNTEKLKSSTIISVHLFLKEDFKTNAENEMIGLVDTTVQWVFVKNKKHLCMVISAADFIGDNLTEKGNDEIVYICFNDLKSNLNGFDEKNVLDFRVIKERRATILPEVGSDNFRMKQKSNLENLFVGGDWTDTGYPSTIEGAIKSAKICSDYILRN